MAFEGERHQTLHRIQDSFLKLLGNSVDGRAPAVRSMLRRGPDEALAYWLQLSVAVGIATLGLVVGSSAVVIGAMLIAPLMVPIVALAMGLATGSPFLVLRSSGRILLSVGSAVIGAATITVLLPFHELNSEILARTTPTALDLLTAAFCAVAGAYAALRSSSDMATTAAGTSIGISLVPPLCVCGYGLGTRAWEVAGGAALLFLTNLVAIVAVGTVAFVACGFNRVDLVSLERDELAEGHDAPLARRLAQRLARLFESRFGPLLRFSMPFVLLAVVYLPLRQALDEVAWEVKVRRAVSDAIAAEPGRIVESRSQVSRHGVELVIVLLGKASDAVAARARLTAAIENVARVKPKVEVFAVPDATAFAGLESTLLTPRPLAAAAPAEQPLGERAQLAGEAVRTALLEVWPSAAGAVLEVSIHAGGQPLRLIVTSEGEALDEVAREALAKGLALRLGQQVVIGSVGLPTRPVTRGDGDLAFMGRIVAATEAVRQLSELEVCLLAPPEKQPSPQDAALRAALQRYVLGRPNVTERPGTEYEFRVVRGDCPPAAGTGEDARQEPEKMPKATTANGR